MGPYLAQPNKEKDSENGENESFRYGATSMQGWRKQQEDAHIAAFLPNNIAVFGVFDGHGGKEVSIFVKAHFCEELQKLQEFKDKKYEEALKIAFRRMDEILETKEGNQMLKEIQAQHGGQDPFGTGTEMLVAQYTGCTATVVLVTKDAFYCANAGDSRSVLARSSGANMTQDLSTDHKPDDIEEKKRIEAAGGFVEENRVNGSLNLSRSMGDFEYKSKKDLDYKNQMVIVDPEVRKFPRLPTDQFLMLACDGIWDCVTSDEGIVKMRESLTKKKPSEPISNIIEDFFEQIVAADIFSSAGVGTDNMTCIIIEIKK